MLRLPVSGLQVIIRQPTGVEDVLLQEVQFARAALAVDLIGRLVRTAGGAPLDWREIPASDLEALLLLMRRTILGDLVSSDARCPAAECGARVDVSFRIGKYLESRKIRMAKRVEKSAEERWFRLAGEDVEFRLPAVADLLSIDGCPAAPRELAQRCVRPADLAPALRHRVEAAMETMAPRYSSSLAGTCPECGTGFHVYFDVLSYVIQEFRNHGACVYQDVHLLALHYNWPEEDILALPRNRRTQYAGMLRGPEVAA